MKISQSVLIYTETKKKVLQRKSGIKFPLCEKCEMS